MDLYYDTETALIAPGLQAPPLTCVSHAIGNDPPGLLDHVQGAELLADALASDWDIYAHFAAFDNLVMCQEDDRLFDLFCRAYDRGRIHCTKIQQQIIDISKGQFRKKLVGNQYKHHGYHLADLARRHLGVEMDKDTWRLRYGELRDVPIADWDPGAIKYAVDDAEHLRMIARVQAPDLVGLNDIGLMTAAQWWLHLLSAWGVRTSPEGVRSLAEGTSKQIGEVRDLLLSEGLIRKEVKKKAGTVSFVRDTKAAKERMLQVCAEAGIPVKETPTGQPCLDEDACKDSEDPLLVAYALYGTLSSVLAKDIPALSQGVTLPIHSRYDMAESGRTTSSKPNVQNWRRLKGVRECFVPREGMHFIQADYSSFELVTLAQTCIDLFGRSALADVLRANEDPHTKLASDLMGISYNEGLRLKEAHDPAFDDMRQLAKAANFGFPGGLGVKKFRLWAKAAYGVNIDLDTGYKTKDAWFTRYPEMADLFEYVSTKTEAGEQIILPRGGLVCGGVNFTQGCNRLFQGPAARAAKAAGWVVTKACYLDESSPLYDSRLVVFVHDEWIGEAAIDRAPEAAEELARLMCAGAQPYLPDVPVKAEPTVMAVWSKDAKTLRDASGRLVAWSP